jgi:teichuronic acid biosynthesis glycosyltransferase TuaH
MVQTGVDRILQKSSQTGLTEDKLDYDILIFALSRWDGDYSSTSYSLAKALSQHTRVFYIDNPFTIKHFYKTRNTPQTKRRKNALLWGKDIFTKPDANHPDLTAVTPKLVFPINWMPAGFWYDTFSKVNDQIVSKAIDQTCHAFGIKKYLLINCFNPHFGKHFSLKQKPFLNIYYNVDDISQGPYLNKHGVALEAAAMKKADFTLVTSSELKNLSTKHAKNVFLLANAANVNLFQKALREDLPVPEEIRLIPASKKIICYVGNICYRLDYDLLKKIASTHPDKILLMIGPFAVDTYKSSGLNKLPNVIFTGKKDLSELPAYLQHVDCCIIPFLCNQLTKSIYPLKINEYLSAGKPVVTTAFSEDIRSFSRVIHVSHTHTDFVRNIDRALTTDSPDLQQERMFYSANNNWTDRARQFIGIVEEFLHANDKRKS